MRNSNRFCKFCPFFQPTLPKIDLETNTAGCSVSFPIWCAPSRDKIRPCIFHTIPLRFCANTPNQAPAVIGEGWTDSIWVYFWTGSFRRKVYVRVYVYNIPVTQMTLVLIWKGFPFGGFNPQNKGKNRFQVYIKIQICPVQPDLAKPKIPSRVNLHERFYLTSNQDPPSMGKACLSRLPYIFDLFHTSGLVLFLFFGQVFCTRLWGHFVSKSES